jgi:hypothetical protein
MQSCKTKSYADIRQQEENKNSARNYSHPKAFPADGETLMQKKSVYNPNGESPNNFWIRRPSGLPGKAGKNSSGNYTYG